MGRETADPGRIFLTGYSATRREMLWLSRSGGLARDWEH
jgi:hypothetical protein